MTSASSCSAEEDSEEQRQVSIKQVVLNRDRSVILICTSHGLSLFGTGSFKKFFIYKTYPEAVTSADVLSGTSLAVTVLESACFQIVNILTRQSISPRVSVGAPILNIKLNPKRILVLTNRKLLIFDLRKLELVASVDRGEGIEGVSASLLVSTDDGFCAMPVSGSAIQLVDTYTLVRMPPVQAHNSSVTALEMSDKFLLTASTKGTVIRVFSLPSLELLGLFRRGRSESPIRSLLLSPDGTLLSVSGDSDTAHVFRMADLNGALSPKISSGSSPPAAVPSSAYQSVLKFFPKQYKEALEAVRDFSTVKLRRENNCQIKYISCVIGQTKSVAQVAVASQGTGFAFVYECNLGKGGECKLKSEYALLSAAEEPFPDVLYESKPPLVSVLPVTIPKPKPAEAPSPPIAAPPPVPMVDIPALKEPQQTHHYSSSLSRTDSGETGDTSPVSEFVVATKKKKKKASSKNFDSE